MNKETYNKRKRLLKEKLDFNPAFCENLIKEGPRTKNLLEELRKIDNKEISVLPSLNEKNTKIYYSSAKKKIKRKCTYPWRGALISPNGDLHICKYKYNVGNIKIRNFLKIWNNKKARRFRSVLKKEGQFPGCNQCIDLYR